jgi:hypothetical protein
MDAKLLSQLERVADAGIQLLPLPQVATHYAFERGGFVILVEKRGEGFGGIGSPGLLAEAGFAPLVDGRFVAKGWERKATADETAGMRQFLADLKAALK